MKLTLYPADLLKASKSTFDTAVTFVRFAIIYGLRFLVQWWFQRTPLFWIPNGWLPRYVEWLLSFPRAPVGSVSIQIWWIACASVIRLLSDTAVAAHALGRQEKGKTRSGTATPMAVPAGQGTNMPENEKEL